MTHLVVVPHDPGPVVQLAAVDRVRNNVDDALDEVFGEVDDDGPGPTDAVLFAGGAIAVVAAQVVALPAIVLVGGIAGLGLGSVLPIRSGLRRFRGRRRRAKIEALIGTGHLLDLRHEVVRELVAVHKDVFQAAGKLTDVQALRARNVAHALLTEVTTLLDGHRLHTPAESSYSVARVDAMRELLRVVVEADQTPDGNGQSRVAQVRARLEVEAATSHSALWEANELVNDMLQNPDV